MEKKDLEACSTLATVKDFSGLDGCQFLLVLENGDKYLPAQFKDQSFVLKDKQVVKFGYKLMENMMSICMAENKAVEVTCIELVSVPPPAKPAKKECVNTETPMRTDWMKTMIENNSIRSVSKYDYRGASAYLFSADLEFFLADCQGTLLCQGNKGEEDACVGKYIESVASGKNIWTKP
ncbi:MAG: hypothetical protein AB8G15_17665 [Saprospiraceae bacterium]